ncbi:MAG: hypothetical protein OEU92_00390 [Alphaproteobacteria bacterium]|nr:hypothetical protein [Alphaproteobacteria bacterium]
MFTAWLRHPFLRIALIAGGLAFALSGCHLHHGYVGGGYAYHGGGGGHHGGHYRGHHKKRHGHHRRHGHGGWRGRY